MKQARELKMIPQGRELATLAIALLFVLLIAIVSYSNWVGFQRTNEQLDITRRIVRSTATLLSDLKDAETGQRGFLLTGREEYLEPYQAAVSRIPQNFAELTNATVTRPDQSQRVEAIKSMVGKKLDELQKTIDLRRSKGADAALPLVMSGEGKAFMDQIRQMCFKIETVAEDRFAQQSAEMKRRDNLIGIVIVFSVVTLFALLVLATATIHKGTERRQQLIKDLGLSEEAARLASVWFQTTLSSIGDAVIATDTKGRVTLLNQVAQSLTGWTQEHAEGLPLNQVFVIRNEETGHIVENPVDKVLREGSVASLANHTKIIAKDGRETPIDDSAAPIRDAEGKITGVVLVFRDITGRKKAELKLKQAEQRFRTAVSAVSDIVWTNNANGEMKGEQPGWAAFTGQSLEEYQGYGWSRAVHPRDAQPTINEWNRAVAERRPFKFEHKVRRHDGVWRVCSICAIPLIDVAGEIHEWVGVHTDITDRKHAEEALRNSQGQLQTLFDAAPVGMYVVDAGMRIRFINPTGQSVFGPIHDLAGRSLIEVLRILWSETAVDDAMDHYRHTLETGLPYHVPEFSDVRLDRKERKYYDWQIHRINLPGGQQGIVTYLVDISPQMLAHQAVIQSEERFRALVEAGSQAIYRMSPDWTEMRQLHVRDFLANTEYPSRTWLCEYIHPEDHQYVTAVIKEAVRTQGIFQLEHRVRLADGTWGWTYSRAVPLFDRPGGDIVEWFGAATDITGRKRSEEKLLEAEERFRNLADNIPQLAWIADPGTDGKIYWFSQNWFRYTGTTLEEMQGSGWHKVHHPYYAGQVIRKLEQHVKEGMDWEDTFPLRGKDGGYRWFLSRMNCIRDESGKVIRIFGTNTDITNQREVEDQLRRANQDLESFAYSASHDLQEPLRMITSYSQLLVSSYKGQLDDEAEICVGFITDGTRRMRELLADLLAYTAVDKTMDDSEIVDLNLVFEEVIKSMKVAIEESGALISCDPLPAVGGHRAHFVQLFQNLISNGIKYRSERPCRIHVSVEEQDDIRRFSVTDNGIGIAPQYHEKIFGVFKRLHGKEIPGTGIGLALCQRVVERFKGRIWVESEPDKGTTFFFTLSFGNGARQSSA